MLFAAYEAHHCQITTRCSYESRITNPESRLLTMKASDIKRGNVVEHNNTVYQVRDIEPHVDHDQIRARDRRADIPAT